jgi:acetyl esterase/lipase
MTQPPGPGAAAPAIAPPDLSAGPLPAPSQIGADGSRLFRELIFATPPGFRPLVLDLHLPAPSAAPAPLVVFLHGGGWRLGTRRSFGPGFAGWSPSPFQLLAGAGLAVASVDYRLSAEAVFPAQVDDVKAAVGWLRGRADELALDADRVATWGESAGGHLAAMAGLDPALRIAAVVDWYGPADLLTMGAQAAPDAVANADQPGSREELFLGAPARSVPDIARAASPVHQVRAGAPPFLLAHGTADRFVPYAQSAQLAEALEGVGAQVQLVPVEGADHMWRGTDPEPLFTAAVDFLRNILI